MRLGCLFVAFALLLLPRQAAAQSCTFGSTGIDFGNVNLTSGGFQSSSGTFTADCSGTPGQTVRICPNFGAGSGGVHPSGDPRYLTQGATTLRYNIFKTNGVGQVWGSYLWGPSSRPPLLTMTLNGSGTGSASQTMFGRLYNQQGALPTGTYVSAFSGTHTQIDYGYAPGFTCGPTLSSRARSVPFTVRATNNSACTVAATDLSFGNHANLDSPVLATNAVLITCTAGTQFEIGLGNGTSGATVPSERRMTNAATPNAIAYAIYRDGGRTQHWGATPGANTISATGTGSAQSFTGYGRVPAQATPEALTYADSVVVTVTY